MFSLAKILCFSLILIISACGFPAQEHSTPTLDIAMLPVLDGFPVVLAYHRGYFAEAGLNVVLHPFTAAMERDTAFQVNRQIDGIVTDVVGQAIFYEGGIPTLATSASIGLASLVGSVGVTDLAQVAGLPALISLNTSMDYILHRALASVGLTQADVAVTSVPSIPVRLELLTGGATHFATLPEPFATLAVDDRGLTLLASTTSLDINPFVYLFREEVVSERSTELLAFYEAVTRAVRLINEGDREVFIDLLIEVVGYPPEVREHLILPTFPLPMPPALHHVEDVLGFARERGLLMAELTAEQAVSDLLASSLPSLLP